MGLTVAELGRAIVELEALVGSAGIVDVARLQGRDDLLLFVETEQGKRCLHLVPGGARGRIALTRRRFSRRAFASGPLVDRLAERLRGGRLAAIAQHPAERACRVELHGPNGAGLALHLEMFGPRGLWCLTDADGKILELSRLPNSRSRTLRPGERYQPPPPGPGGPAPDAVPRFADAAAIDAFFTEKDRADEFAALRDELLRAVDVADRRATHRSEGLRRQAEAALTAPDLRAEADLLLAYGYSARPGQRSLTVPDPRRDGGEVVLTLDPQRTPAEQAQVLYGRARKLEKAAQTTELRLREIEAERAPLAPLRQSIEAASTLDALEELREALRERGLVRDPKPAKPPAPVRKANQGENFRRFDSSEGYPILVGRTNVQNDRLSMRTARGNDLWFHVGGGRPGSHVVVRVPRGKTASLETLLDAATLAIHFSKARGTPVCEVIYTHAKHVSKPKGLPPGRVLTHHTKTLGVRLEPDRLARLLDSAPES